MNPIHKTSLKQVLWLQNNFNMTIFWINSSELESACEMPKRLFKVQLKDILITDVETIFENFFVIRVDKYLVSEIVFFLLHPRQSEKVSRTKIKQLKSYYIAHARLYCGFTKKYFPVYKIKIIYERHDTLIQV
jgi:hypothetical protein